jgi:DegT/DnrJ/EryC1/StrS aminotransferase family
MEAALGLAQLEDWQSVIGQRRRNVAFLTKSLGRFDNILQTPDIRPDCEHSFMMYPIVLRDQDKRGLVNFLEDNGIETRDMLPLTNQPVYQQHLGWREDEYPVAKWINSNGFYLGCHQDLSNTDLEYIIDSIERFFVGTRSQTFEGVILVLLTDENTRPTWSTPMFSLPSFSSKPLSLTAGWHPNQKRSLRRRGSRSLKLGVETNCSDRGDERCGKVRCRRFFPLNGQWSPKDIPRLVMVLNRGYDMVVASQFMMGGERQGKSGTLRSLGNRVFNLVANLLFVGNLSDGFSSFRAVRRSKLATVTPPGRGPVQFFALSIEAMKRGSRIQEIPTVEVTRSTWQVINDSLSTVFPALLILAREWWSRRRPGSGEVK